MVRAIETMTWLFRWLSWKEGRARETSGNYGFLEMMRGMHVPRYSIAYRDSGVAVLPHDRDHDVKTDTELFRAQYLATLDEKHSDVELFALMSLAYLGIDAEDAPPKPSEDPIVYERYLIGHKDRSAIVFCVECDGLIDSGTIEAVTLRCLGREEHRCSALCIVNHEKHKPVARRKVENAVADDADQLPRQHGLTLITALDLRSLVHGAIELGWNVEEIRNILFIPGRQGLAPPGYRRVGAYCRLYPRLSVVSVEVNPGETVRVGDTLAIRVATRWYEQRIESLQVEHNAVRSATGPCRVGIKTTLHKSGLAIGQAVFIRFSDADGV
jgi:hypothetical protein